MSKPKTRSNRHKSTKKSTREKKTTQIKKGSQTKKSLQSKKNPLSNPANRRWLLITAAAAIVLVILAFLAITQQYQLAEAPATTVSVAQAYDKYNQGVFLLDVREQSEWDDFHIPDTTLIPLGELESRLAELPEDQEIVVVCRSGNRSQDGLDILKANGFVTVSSMDGGVTEWKAAGYPITTGP